MVAVQLAAELEFRAATPAQRVEWAGVSLLACVRSELLVGSMAWSLLGWPQSYPPMAWEMGPLGPMFPGWPGHRVSCGPPAVGTSAVLGARAAAEVDHVPSIGGAPVAKRARLGARRASGPPPGAADERLRQAAKRNWVDILTCFRNEGAAFYQGADLDLYVDECAPLKATGTLDLRAGSVRLFFVWCQEVG